MFLSFSPSTCNNLARLAHDWGYFRGAGLAMAAAQAPAGYLADRIGSRGLMWGAWITGIVAAGLRALGQSLWVFVVGLLLYGITAYVSTPMNSYVADMRGSWGVGKAFALTQALYSLGAVGGPALGGWIGEQFGLRSVYLGAFVVFIFSFSVIVFYPPPAGAKTNSHRSNFEIASQLKVYVSLTLFLPDYPGCLPASNPYAKLFTKSTRFIFEPDWPVGVHRQSGCGGNYAGFRRPVTDRWPVIRAGGNRPVCVDLVARNQFHLVCSCLFLYRGIPPGTIDDPGLRSTGDPPKSDRRCLRIG